MKAKKKVKKKLLAQDTLDLVNLHSSTIENGFMRAIRNRLDISQARHVAQQPNVFAVHFYIAGKSGGITTHLAVGHHEVVQNLNGRDKSKLRKLLADRAVTAGQDMVRLILENGARHLAWNRASRWQRIKWAWRGVIQPDV